jgi:vacuolar-type H+-ATPase subunit I/STV1
MSEVDVFVFEENIDAVAEAVASLGVMHLLDAKALGQWSSEIDSEWPSRVSQYTNQERRVGDLLKVLGIPERPHTCDECLAPASDLSILEEQLVEIEGRVFALRDEDLRLGRQRERLEMLHRSMETLAPINVSIADLRKLEHLHLVVGTLPIENLERLEASLFRIPYAIIPVYRHSSQGLVRSLFSQRQVLVFAFCAQRHAPILDRALESAFLDPLQLPEDFSGTGQEVLDQVHAQMDATTAQLAEVRQRYAALADEVGERLLVMLTKIRRDRAVAEAMLHFGHRGRVYLIAGWVPKDKVEELRIAVENAAKGRATFEENPPSVLGQSQVPPC